jgi:hypothetical protein
MMVGDETTSWTCVRWAWWHGPYLIWAAALATLVLVTATRALGRLDSEKVALLPLAALLAGRAAARARSRAVARVVGLLEELQVPLLGDSGDDETEAGADADNELGRGAFGRVCKVPEWRGRAVALKRLAPAPPFPDRDVADVLAEVVRDAVDHTGFLPSTPSQ